MNERLQRLPSHWRAVQWLPGFDHEAGVVSRLESAFVCIARKMADLDRCAKGRCVA